MLTRKTNQKGSATLEIVPLISILILLVNFGIGFFGVIHSGILNSIAARNYAFDTFANRADLNWLRDFQRTNINKANAYSPYGMRFHAIKTENASGVNHLASKRSIKFSEAAGGDTVGLGLHAEQNAAVKQIVANQKASDRADTGVNPVWIQIRHGICLSSECGED